MQEALVRFPGWEDPLEKGKATYSSILAWRIPWTSMDPVDSYSMDSVEFLRVRGVAKNRTQLSDFLFTSFLLL